MTMTNHDIGQSDSAALKQMAGLIQKLSYRDMKRLGELLAQHTTDSTPEGYAEGALKTADAILGPSDARDTEPQSQGQILPSVHLRR